MSYEYVNDRLLDDTARRKVAHENTRGEGLETDIIDDLLEAQIAKTDAEWEKHLELKGVLDAATGTSALRGYGWSQNLTQYG